MQNAHAEFWKSEMAKKSKTGQKKILNIYTKRLLILYRQKETMLNVPHVKRFSS